MKNVIYIQKPLQRSATFTSAAADDFTGAENRINHKSKRSVKPATCLHSYSSKFIAKSVKNNSTPVAVNGKKLSRSSKNTPAPKVFQAKAYFIFRQ